MRQALRAGYAKFGFVAAQTTIANRNRLGNIMVSWTLAAEGSAGSIPRLALPEHAGVLPDALFATMTMR